MNGVFKVDVVITIFKFVEHGKIKFRVLGTESDLKIFGFVFAHSVLDSERHDVNGFAIEVREFARVVNFIGDVLAGFRVGVQIVKSAVEGNRELGEHEISMAFSELQHSKNELLAEAILKSARAGFALCKSLVVFGVLELASIESVGLHFTGIAELKRNCHFGTSQICENLGQFLPSFLLTSQREIKMACN